MENRVEIGPREVGENGFYKMLFKINDHHKATNAI